MFDLRCSRFSLCPSFQVTAQRTFDWVLSQKLKKVLKVQEDEEKRNLKTSR